MPLIIAHRGASRLAPQNTVAAFEEALKLGADGIETDVHLTKDGLIVLCHNYEVDETSLGSGNISDLTFDEIRKLDFGSKFSSKFKGEKIPTIEEFLDCVKNMKKIIIEIKTPKADNAIAEKTVEAVRDFGLLSKTVFSCFCVDILKQCKKADKNAKTAMLFDMRTECAAEILEDPKEFCYKNGIDELHPIVFFISDEFVKKCVKCSIDTFFWTINDPSSRDALDMLGVTGIITDIPEKFVV